MASRRRKRKEKVYYNSDTDTWSNDSNEQPYLMPGTASYEAYQAKNQEQLEKKIGDDFHHELEAHNESIRDEQLEKSKLIDDAFHVGNRKFRRQRSKERLNSDVEKIIDDGLGHGAAKIKHNENVYDDGVNDKQYAKKVVRDYKSEFENLCQQDNNNDGKVDEDDWTPGMRKLSRYM